MEPDVVEYNKTMMAKDSSQNLMQSSTTRIVSYYYMTLFLVQNHERVRTFKAKTITIDDITLPVIVSTICKNASTLHMQKLTESLAKEPISTQCANKHAIQMLDTIKSRSPVHCQRQMQASKCQSSTKLLRQLINELPIDGTLDDWKN